MQSNKVKLKETQKNFRIGFSRKCKVLISNSSNVIEKENSKWFEAGFKISFSHPKSHSFQISSTFQKSQFHLNFLFFGEQLRILSIRVKFFFNDKQSSREHFNMEWHQKILWANGLIGLKPVW